MGDSSHWQRIRSPAAAGARETKTTNDATSALGEPSVSFAAAQLAIGVFGAAIVLSYPVGFITLWVQIMDTYSYDFSDALYATSMVPTSVVAGQAVFVLGYAPLAAYVMYNIARLRHEVFKEMSKLTSKLGSVLQRLLLIIGVAVVVFAIFYGVIWYFYSLLKAILFITSLYLLIFGGLFSGMLYEGLTKAQGPGRYTRSIIIAGIPFVVSALITGVCMNILFSGLELPTIELLKKNSDNRVEGTLLSHMDGSWHLINSSQPKHPLIAVPNERVFKVKIAEQ
jgi:hypothetical protein